jgi:hypothetical protein
MKERLIEPWEVRKYIGAAVPDTFRRSYDLQESSARRKLEKILNGNASEMAPEPWESPDVAIAVLEEYMLTQKWEVISSEERQAITQLWQAYQTKRAMTMAAPAQAPGQPAPGGATGDAAAGGIPQEMPDAMQPAEGVAQLEAEAEAAVAPADGAPPA